MSAFTEANRKAFDELSATYNSKPWQIALSNQVKSALQARKEWIGAEWLKPEDKDDDREVKLLDFASGTGNISNALGEYVTTIRGIDISAKMVEAYNAAAAKSSDMHAVEGDLFAAEGTPAHLSTPEFSNFDIAAVGLGFHHFEDPALALSRLAERLKPITGILVIVDFLPFSHLSSQPGDGSAPTIKHHGFTPEQLRDLYTAAGFTDFDIIKLKEPAKMEIKGEHVEREIFIAKGRKTGSVLQRLGAWLGAAQDVVGGQMRVDKSVDGKWNPGLEKTGKEWNMVGKREGEDWDGFAPKGEGSGEGVEKKHWNGF